MARKRFQRPTPFQRGTREKKWFYRWREDIVEADGSIRRVRHTEELGSLKDLPTLRIALRELDRRMAAVNAMVLKPKHNITFSVIAEKFKTTVLPQHKPSSKASETTHVDLHLVPFFGSMQLDQITAEAVQKFVAQPKYHPKTMRNIFKTFRVLWKMAKGWGYVHHNACEGVVLPRNVAPKRRFYTLEEVKKILAHATGADRLAYWLLAETGMRVGELCGLECSDIKENIVRVRQSVWRGQIGTPKSINGVRTFRISQPLFDALTTHIRESGHQMPFLFHTSSGEPWDSSNLRKRVTKLCKRCGVNPKGLHAFRHGNASLMDQLGVPMKTRQARLGHSTAALTMDVYTHAISTDDVKAADELGKILDPTSPKLEGLIEEVVPVQQDTFVVESIGAGL